jgi:hypothetical protein
MKKGLRQRDRSGVRAVLVFESRPYEEREKIKKKNKKKKQEEKKRKRRKIKRERKEIVTN